MELGGIVLPSGREKSSSGSSFHVPKSPLVWFLKDFGAAKTIDRAPFTSVTVTAIPDGKLTRKELFCGLETATEPFNRKESLVRLS